MVLVVAVAILATATTAITLLLRHSAGRPTSPSVSPLGSVDGGGELAQAENTFIGATAAHLCNVASTVFDDPKALADAYNSTPDYPGLTPGQVKTFQRRLATDAGFNTRLADQLRATCQRPTSR
jgi:hypothetical protein